jgi:hypothetical protein
MRVYSGLLFLFQLILGIPEQALTLLHMAIEPILADGAVLDKGRAMFLVSKCQVASAASYDPVKKAEGRSCVESAGLACRLHLLLNQLTSPSVLRFSFNF